MSTKKLIVGNWKMNPETLEEAKTIARKTRAVAKKLDKVEVVICPPAVFIGNAVSKRDKSVAIGAQDVSIHDNGSHTGDVGARMLSDIGLKYVIAGHSERRKDGETDEIVSKKVIKVLDAGLTAILCVGEQKREESGTHYDYVRDQIKNSLANVPSKYAKNVIIAYEPVWAIGATEAMDPKEICEMAIFVRKVFSDIFTQDSAMKAKVLYGGSVNFRNAYEIISVSKVDGLLVGRESVNIPGFKELLKAVNKI